jgi:hypothetical protein
MLVRHRLTYVKTQPEEHVTPRYLATICALIYAAAAQAAEPRDVQNVLDKYRSIRPQDADLAIYQLDWTPTLKAAKDRAAKENRPIFLIIVRNAFGDLASGHC